MNTQPRKRVVRFNMWYHSVMAERFAREPDFELRTCELTAPEDAAWAALAEAHAYQISSAKDEIPRQWFANSALLERSPSCCACRPTARATTLSTSRPARKPACWSSIRQAPMRNRSPSTPSGPCSTSPAGLRRATAFCGASVASPARTSWPGGHVEGAGPCRHRPDRPQGRPNGCRLRHDRAGSRSLSLGRGDCPSRRSVGYA